MPVWFVYNAPVGACPLIRYGGVFVRGGGAAHCKVLNIAVEDVAGFYAFSESAQRCRTSMAGAYQAQPMSPSEWSFL